MNTEDQRLLVLPCKRRSCPECGPKHWKPYQQAKYMSGVEGVEMRLLKIGALTAPGADVLPDGKAIADWNATAPHRWSKFVRLMREAYPLVELDFWKVWEIQDGSRRADKLGRGALHAHYVMRGLRWVDIPTLRRCAVEAGFGPRVRIENVRKDRGGLKGLLGYFTCYLLKAVDQWRTASHVITKTHGWALNWRKKRKREGEAEWVWISAADAVAMLNYMVPVDGGPGGSDLLRPRGGGCDVEGTLH